MIGQNNGCGDQSGGLIISTCSVCYPTSFGLVFWKVCFCYTTDAKIYYYEKRSLSFSFEHMILILCIYGGRMGGSPAPLLSGYSHGARSDHVMRCGFLIIHTAHELSISKDFIIRLPGSALCCKSIIWAHNSH